MTSVSVLIPNLNGIHHLDDCLSSLQQQSHPADEVIVFDNASSDDSARFISQRYSSVRLIASEKNLGFAGALNRAAEAACGEWLAFLNNDMRASSDWIAAAMKSAREHACVASRILSWSGDKVDFDGASLQYLGFGDQVGIGETSSRRSPAGPILFACGGAMLVRKEVFLESGAFDEDYFAIYEDVDFGWRLWLQGHDVFFEPESFVYHKGHATLDTRREEKKRYLMHRNALFTIIKNYERERFEKIVPVAFFQAVRRAVRFANIDKTSFYFWKDSEPPQDPGAFWMWKDAINHLVALDDVIENWPGLMQKRAAVQARRRRSDDEIVALFRDPFRRIFKDTAYEAQEAELLELQGIPQLFPSQAPFALTDDFRRNLHEEIRNLRRELSYLKSARGAVPPEVKANPVRKFVKRIKKLGSR
ncbi:MAG TPA: glycosyltransferase family 2 protein [Acidobacteriota bacterium]|jgi:hypothetical protein